MQNWYYEPFRITKIVSFRGVYKYGISPYNEETPLKYWFYEDQLQQINPEVASQYIRAWLKNGVKIADSEE